MSGFLNSTETMRLRTGVKQKCKLHIIWKCCVVTELWGFERRAAKFCNNLASLEPGIKLVEAS